MLEVKLVVFKKTLIHFMKEQYQKHKTYTRDALKLF